MLDYSRLGPRIAHYAHADAERDQAWLHHALQTAIELEHATIPAYLFALYSIQPGANTAAAAIIQSIVAEEMLHMALAANILNAIGGHPQLGHAGFIPEYPCVLPLGPQKHLLVPLERCSKQLIHDVFMVIEQPEYHDPGAGEPKHTLGAFYHRIGRAIEALGEPIFTGKAERQVVGPLGREQIFAVRTVADARRAIRAIVDQGEGAGLHDPSAEQAGDEGGDELAHYYRFAEIYEGRQANVRGGEIVYDGAAVPFDEGAIWQVAPNPKTAQLAPGSPARRQASYFNTMYSNLLRVLHRAFNGEPGLLDRAVGMMFALKLQAQELMATPIGAGAGGPHAGPSFEYVPAQ